MHPDEILIRGAKEHNLKNIDVTLPRFKLVVITGVSGSGKSSLAFDTLYAEGQRRYVESLSAYARQFIGQMEKPKVDYIGGLSPAIAIEQKAVSRNPRSTVGTVTEIYDYLRVLFARVGTPHCPQCGRVVQAQSAQEIVERVAELPAGRRFQVLSPIARNRKGAFQDTFAGLRADGFSRARVDGEIRELDETITLDKKKKHHIELVVDRLVSVEMDAGEPRTEFVTRLTDSIETALRVSEGLVLIDAGEGDEWLLSEQNACPDCGLSFPALTPAMFSFNSPPGHVPGVQWPGHAVRVRLRSLRRSGQESRTMGVCAASVSCARNGRAAPIRSSSRSSSSLARIWIRPGGICRRSARMRSCMVG